MNGDTFAIGLLLFIVALMLAIGSIAGLTPGPMMAPSCAVLLCVGAWGWWRDVDRDH